ncbi:hypothetical protein C8R44DRAFT_865508 [Mycena epipterygia]|nr:hypothetical protein C8R44DRAFT_865508 [Mycena epipterygia]
MTSDWVAEKLTDDQIRYAALDTMTSLQLHEVLVGALDRKSSMIATIISSVWYTFNSRIDEATRVKRAADGTEIPWRLSEVNS